MALGSLAWFLMGALLMVSLGWAPGFFLIPLTACSVFAALVKQSNYWTILPPVIWRFLLYLTAGASTDYGLNGLVLWSALALGCYVAGVELFRLNVSMPNKQFIWPILLISPPLFLSLMVNGPGFRLPGFFYSFFLLLWLYRSLRQFNNDSALWLGRIIPDLKSGIILVDLLAVAGGSIYSSVFLLWFGLSFLLNRMAPGPKTAAIGKG